MYRKFGLALALAVLPVAATAQSGFWYPSCSSGNCGQSGRASYVIRSQVCPTGDFVRPVAVSPNVVGAVPPNQPLNSPVIPTTPPAPSASTIPPPNSVVPKSVQPSPSDVNANAASRDQEFEALRREIEFLKQRNDGIEQAIRELQESQKNSVTPAKPSDTSDSSKKQNTDKNK